MWQVLSEGGPALLTLGHLYFWTLATPWASKLPANWNLATGPSEAEGVVVSSGLKGALKLSCGLSTTHEPPQLSRNRFLMDGALVHFYLTSS